MTRRLLLFVAFLLLALGILEFLVRNSGEYFEALSDKTSMRIKIFERSPSDLGLLFIGTSRFVDGIDGPLVSKGIEEQTGKSIKTLNGASAGIDVNGIIRFANAASQRVGLEAVVLEASVPGLSPPKSVQTEEVKKTESEVKEKKSGFGPRLEEALQTGLAKRLGIVTYRKALRPASVANLLTLYSGNMMDTAIWKRKGVLRELMSSPEPGIDKEQFVKITPVVTTPAENGIAGNATGDLSGDQTLENMVRLTEILTDSHIKVIWVAPPVTLAVAGSEGGETRAAAYRHIASHFGTQVFDYSQAAIPGDCFRDPTHLNKKGRTLFSRLLARDLADHL